MDTQKAHTIMRWGMIPQMTMILSFIICSLLYGTTDTGWSPIRIIDMAGSGLFLYCLYVLYVRRGRTTGLITTGPFKYTRHPMYTGLFLMNLSWWIPLPTSADTLFYTLQAVFLCTLIIAGWFQEKETLARFGAEAEAYYRRTPRLFFMYPLQNAVT